MPGPRRRRPSRSLLGDATDLSRRTPRRSRAPWSAPSSSETSRRAPPAACAGRRPLAWLSARRRECLHRAHTEKRQIERAAGAFGLGLDFLIFALIDFGLGFRLDRDLAVAVRDGLAFDFHTLSHVFGQVLAGDERIPRTFITAVVADLRQEVVPVEALLQAPDHGHVLSALDLDLGLRRRLRLLRLRGQACGTHRDETDRDCCQTCLSHGGSCGAGATPASKSREETILRAGMVYRFAPLGSVNLMQCHSSVCVNGISCAVQFWTSRVVSCWTRRKTSLEPRGITCRMSRRGSCCDNAVMESACSTVKSELGQHCEASGSAKEELFDDIEVFYNQRRRHSPPGRIIPAAF